VALTRQSPRHLGEEASNGDAADHQKTYPFLCCPQTTGRRDIPAAPFTGVMRTCPAAASGSDEGGDEGRRGEGGWRCCGRISPPGRLEEAT
jgi:hypothetical protein